MEKPFLSSSRLFGLILLGLIVSFAIIVPLVLPGDLASQNLRAILQSPLEGTFLGTDHFGRDIAHRLAAALRLSLAIAFLSVLLASVLGFAAGLLAARAGGLVDKALCAFSDMILALPGLLLVLMIVALSPGSHLMIYLGISLVLWVEYFRLSRTLAERAYASPAVEASRQLGLGEIYIMRFHLWPEMAPLLLTTGAFGAANAILAVAALGFVNVGVRPPTPELGQMLIELMPYYQEAPWVFIQPVLVLFLLVLSLLLIAGEKQ